ncbi:MAG: hypothetical protein J0H94_05205 [Rhizobiales bacterium]|nr:hypothetical protein [Hyphomicrobiales bacterium]
MFGGSGGRKQRRRLFVHAGTHKTGTTSIQKVLADNRDWLAERGLVYARGGGRYGNKHAHHGFAQALIGDDAGKLRAAREFVRAMAREGKPSDTLLISAEPIYRHIDRGRDRDFYGYQAPDYWVRRRAYLHRLAEMLRDFDVTIILFLRDKDAFAQSLYREVTTQGDWAGDFPDFLKAFAPWFEYERQIGLFEEAFGQVVVRDYDASLARGVIRTFFETIGFPVPPASDTVWVNRSVTDPPSSVEAGGPDHS